MCKSSSCEGALHESSARVDGATGIAVVFGERRFGVDAPQPLGFDLHGNVDERPSCLLVPSARPAPVSARPLPAGHRGRRARRLSAQAHLGADDGGAPGPARRRPTRHERHLDYLVIHACGLGLEQTIGLSRARGADASTSSSAGSWRPPAASSAAARRAHQCGGRPARATRTTIKRGWPRSRRASRCLSRTTSRFWDEHGYVVLHDAVPADSRDAAAQALWEHLGARADDPETWYRAERPRHHGAVFPAPGLRGQSPQPAHPQGLRAALGHRRSVGHHRPRRLQRAGAPAASRSAAPICIGTSA